MRQLGYLQKTYYFYILNKSCNKKKINISSPFNTPKTKKYLYYV
jgi:hypothetical protein